jgi:hypothetical protein
MHLPWHLGLLSLLVGSLLACGTSSSSGSGDSGTGGSSSSGGGGGSGSGSGGCLTGTVDFDLHLSSAATTRYCLGPSGGCAGNLWLSIVPADGGTELSQVMGCVPTCSSCQPVACSNLCVVTTALGDAGAHTTWDGTYLEHTTCGASVACTDDKCAPAGDYVARMCGYPESADASLGADCLGSATPTCVDVPFTWPPTSGTARVEATIGGSSDAGSLD